MKRTLLARLTVLTLSFGAAGGCAAIDGNFVGKAAPSNGVASNTTKPIEYEPMSSLPPASQKEDHPPLAANEVWVPGYYQPVAGNWLWHQGAVQEKRDGYTLL